MHQELLFHYLETITQKTKENALFIEHENGWLMDIEWKEDKLLFRTDWKPRPEVIKAIADLFEADFFYQYNEVQNFVYGEYEYVAGKLKHLQDWLM